MDRLVDLGYSSRRVVPRPPPGIAACHAPGPDPVRLLVLGTGVVFGHGVLSHDLALPGTVARSLAARLHRGVDVSVNVRERWAAVDFVAEIGSLVVGRADAVLLSLGHSEAFADMPTEVWRQTMAAVLDGIQARAGRPVLTAVLELSELGTIRGASRAVITRGNRRMSGLNQALAELCEARKDTCLVLRLSDLPVEEPTPMLYREWAANLGPALAARLEVELMHRARADIAGVDDAVVDSAMVGAVDSAHQSSALAATVDELRRQQALDRLQILDTEPEDEIDRLARLTQEHFGTAMATVTFVDRDRQWHKAVRGPLHAQSPRAYAICDHTIRHDAAFVVEDTTTDERFSANPGVTGAPFIRFYAGYPIETPDGYRVGTLCVIDTQPREFPEQDRIVLRNLALMVQDLLWERANAITE
ncbi:GAF domain-containing protein [Marisediminicola senii]|uniref:GAF domain-containing protein n=1 Tax=Marisediminicola senii TaxID=2711233 RepID=UPI0013EBE115|nr:GAF domain-containing protein [Marisediminicola senii]